MNGSQIPELCGFIENEINYGFTLVQSVRLASSEDCNLQAINSAVTAYETARRSVAHVSLAKRNPRWGSRLIELKTALRSVNWRPDRTNRRP
jgi:hypothetical protein